MGLGVGVWDGTNCSNVTGGTYPAGPTAQLSGTTPAAQYCLVVQDVGNQCGADHLPPSASTTQRRYGRKTAENARDR